MTENSQERLPVRIYKRASEASIAAANEIADLIRVRAAEGRNCVLGLATGSTPSGIYAELVRLHREEGLSFANVVTFSSGRVFSDGTRTNCKAMSRFVHEHLIDHVDINRDNVHVPDGTISKAEVQRYCQHYEQNIEQAGGIDIQLLGISPTGHIGCNEPGSERSSRTRMITLDRVTRVDAASDFFGAENVPRHAITMGVGTILEARRILLLAFGEGKAPIIAKTVEQPAMAAVPASFLQGHSNVSVLLDEAAASGLTRVHSPWLVGEIVWDEVTTRRAVITLASHVGKAILKLTEADYNEEGFQDLLASYGNAYDINLRVFRHLQSTITGWPGGKPDHAKHPGDRPGRRDDIFPKRVICFSPHPDDDVISMGGTLIRLVDQGHEVHVAYQTSGNIAVFDEDALKYSEFAADFCREFQIQAEGLEPLETHVDEFLRNKRSGQVDSDTVQRIKALIRRSEAREGCAMLRRPGGTSALPGFAVLSDRTRQKTPTRRGGYPHHDGLAAQDSAPPDLRRRRSVRSPRHPPHLPECDFAGLRALPGGFWYKDCDLWLYRGAWQEWAIEQIRNGRAAKSQRSRT